MGYPKYFTYIPFAFPQKYFKNGLVADLQKKSFGGGVIDGVGSGSEFGQFSVITQGLYIHFFSLPNVNFCKASLLGQNLNF